MDVAVVTVLDLTDETHGNVAGLGLANVTTARVVNKMGLEDDDHNFLLMHAMGPNVAGVIGSAVAAGALLNALSVL